MAGSFIERGMTFDAYAYRLVRRQKMLISFDVGHDANECRRD